MASYKCFVFVLLCLTVPLISCAADTCDSPRHGLFVIGPCSKIPNCNNKCVELHFSGGECFKQSSSATVLSCGCCV
ncbi:unnamed protein product [Brassica oleracea var. botrytis]|uniref:Knottin scorpion toxin-like domain-containing protein n=2 Tax=Brassica oleracea TaxID=3712 RepID=A0A0D3CSN0_BRAOL|nr:unnamed protein product [Brassica oleracea]